MIYPDRFSLADKCFADNDPKGELGVVFVFRRRRDCYELGSFLIDAGCLGVKNAFYALLTIDEMPVVIKKQFGDEREAIERSPAWARKLVEEAATYAKRFGFAPHRDYKKAARVFGGVNIRDCPDTFTFGVNGKPLYVQVPDDSEEKARRILGVLERRCGKNGYNYFILAPMSADAGPRDAIRDQVDKFLEMTEEGSHDLAEKGLNKLVLAHPESPVALYGLAMLRVTQKDEEGAIPLMRKVVEMDERFGQAWYNLAILYRDTMKVGSMVLALRKAVAFAEPGAAYLQMAQGLLKTAESFGPKEGIDPEHYLQAALLFERAFEDLEAERWEEALEGFQASLQHNPLPPSSWGNAGLCLGKLERFEEARSCLKKALELDPDYAPAKNNLAVMEEWEGLAPEERKERKDIFVAINKSLYSPDDQ